MPRDGRELDRGRPVLHADGLRFGAGLRAVSREDHCLSDLLWRWRNRELGDDLVAVVSNHPDHAEQVASAGVPFHYVPVEPASCEAAERQVLELLGGVDLLVLARYMQILSGRGVKPVGATARSSSDPPPPAPPGGQPNWLTGQ